MSRARSPNECAPHSLVARLCYSGDLTVTPLRPSRISSAAEVRYASRSLTGRNAMFMNVGNKVAVWVRAMPMRFVRHIRGEALGCAHPRTLPDEQHDHMRG